jgi:arylformamidase
LIAAVGADESQEFIRQSLDIAGTWSRAGVKAECVVVPSANHFTMVDELVRPESAMLARIVGLARQ